MFIKTMNIIGILLGVIQKVSSLETSSFWPPPPFVLHVPPVSPPLNVRSL